MDSVKNSLIVYLMLRIILLDEVYCFTPKIDSGILYYLLHKTLCICSKHKASLDEGNE
jgi:hypothetical protein